MIALGWLRVALIDLGRDWRKFAVLLACLALGVGTIAAVGSVGAALQSAIGRDARVILGGDLEAIIGYRPAKPNEVALFDKLGQVSEVIELTSRGLANGKSALLSVRAVDQAYPLVGSVSVAVPGGANPPLPDLLAEREGQYGAVVEPLLLDRLGIKLGQSFTIGNQEFVARARLVALPDQAVRGLQLGASVLVSDKGLEASGLLQPGVLARYRYKIALKDQSFAQASATITKAFPDAGFRLRSPQDGTANLARYFDIFDRFLILVGLSSLLVGGIGVSNAVTAYITDRQRAVATMASLGATGRRIMTHFLIQIMVLALAGTVLGLVLGGLTSLLALPLVGQLLAIKLTGALYPAPLVTASLFGLLIAFVFAYLPLVRARFMRPASLFRSSGGVADGPRLGWRHLLRPWVGGPVLAGLAGIIGLAMVTTGQPGLVAWYGAGAVGAFVVLRLASWVLQRALGLVPPLKGVTGRLALRNIVRPGAPTPTVILSLGLGLTLILVIAQIQANVRGQLEGQLAGRAPSFVLMNVSKAQMGALTKLAASDQAITDIKFAPFLRGVLTSINGKKIADLGLSPRAARRFGGDRPLSWAKELPEASRIVEGKWWAPDYNGPPLVSLDEDLKAPLHLKIGDTMEIAISGRPIKVTVASFRHLNWRDAGMSFAILFSPGLIEQAPGTFMGTLKSASSATPAIEADLIKNFPDLAFIPIADALDQVANIISSLANAVSLVGGLALVSGVFVLAGALAAGRKQREADGVIVKVLGATRGDIGRAYLIEYGLLGALASLVAGGLGTLGAWAMVTQVLQLDFSFDFGLVVWVGLGAVAVTIATGLATTWSALSRRPAQFLRAAE